MKLFIKKLNEKAIIPQRATKASAGYDLSACIEEDIVIIPGEIVKVKTGISIEPDNLNVAILIYARSSLATKHGIALANSVGVVDSDYRGEIIVALINNSKKEYVIKNGERIAQMLITPVVYPEVVQTDSLTDTERGIGGFGSTGRI